MAKVSVIIPVYNIAAQLRQCLDSVAGQTLADLEIICVDDGSTDASSDILAEFTARDRRFTVLTQANAGPGAARNLGLSHATGEYLIFLDSDDWFAPELLEKLLRQAERTGADITICRSVEFDTATGREYPSAWMLKTEYLPDREVFAPRDVADYLFQFTYGWPWDKLYRTGFVRDKGLRYPPLPNSEDLVFVFRSMALAERITVINETLVHHRTRRAESVSNSRRYAPEVPWQALCLLREGLEKSGVFAVYARSFLNWAMEFLIWNVANMGDRRARNVFFHKLKREWLPALELERHPAAYYFDRFAYAKYLLVRFAPYPVFAAVTDVYQRLKG